MCPTWRINIDTPLPWTLSTQTGPSYGQLLGRNAGGGGLYLKRRLLATKTPLSKISTAKFPLDAELPESTAKIISVLKLGIKMALALRAYLLSARTSNFSSFAAQIDVFSLCSLV